ncbi:putative phosphatidylglycerol/phosphatidylinositol transfer protein DDB_G0282107 [Halichondria panicea]|uniref:putative phosphatidylglycerol/phosphatidylinositol transfer protein DDB_G0282107 n=1 Tax=Halichondria panicea TaxID=6063 RepID=UPI00312B56AF
MKTVTVLVCFCLLLVSSSAAKQFNVGDIWKDCSKSGDAVKINSVTISPEQPEKGETVSVEAVITVQNNTMITGGKINVTASLDNVPLLEKIFDLCSESSIIGVNCPLTSGQRTLSAKPTITDLAPPGNYTILAIIEDQNKQEVLCIKADFKL